LSGVLSCPALAMMIAPMTSRASDAARFGAQTPAL